ncbi:hypothetical protein HAX54_037634 [Datura stramonium]|uniref:BHLH domain-containing protein n=1 Tax=Datura stramonium TaxID=4076 RepID=A0ABS8VJR7_DATST|nr:hypothetical protein [Datura stramonium]
MSDTKMGLVDNYDQYYDHAEFGMNDHSSPELYGINEEPPKSIFEECENSEKITSPKIGKNFGLSSCNSSLSSPSSSNSNGHSVINFKGGTRYLSLTPKGSSNTSPRVINDNSNSNGIPFGWLTEVNASTATHVEESRGSISSSSNSLGVNSEFAAELSIVVGNTVHIEDFTASYLIVNNYSALLLDTMQEESMQTNKKQCSGGSKKGKLNNNSIATKDPQSIAAKNRRERISERLKILQELVPNGSKVDLVTMLEKAISYVKFLQLQVKVLATDEFWPTQGGKAPDISQVKEAIDAILATQRDRNSTSK